MSLLIMAEEYIHNADEYWDLKHFGLIDRNGRIVSNMEQHEFMMGYYEEYYSKKRGDSLDTMLLASIA